MARLPADAAHHALSTHTLLADQPAGPRRVRIALAEVYLLLYGELLSYTTRAIDDGVVLSRRPSPTRATPSAPGR